MRRELKKVSKICLLAALMAFGALSPASLSSNIKPTLDFDEYPYPENVGVGDSPEARGAVSLKPIIANSTFPKKLGVTLEQLKTSILDAGYSDDEYYSVESQTINSTTVLAVARFDYHGYFGFDSRTTTPQPQAIYIFENGVCTGYALMELLEVYEPDDYPPFGQIGQLPKDKAFNALEVKFRASDRQINFSKVNRSDEYLERYGRMVLKASKQDIEWQNAAKHTIVLQTFYHKKFDAQLLPQISASLNHNIQYYGSWFIEL